MRREHRRPFRVLSRPQVLWQWYEPRCGLTSNCRPPRRLTMPSHRPPPQDCPRRPKLSLVPLLESLFSWDSEFSLAGCVVGENDGRHPTLSFNPSTLMEIPINLRISRMLMNRSHTRGLTDTRLRRHLRGELTRIWSNKNCLEEDCRSMCQARARL